MKEEDDFYWRVQIWVGRNNQAFLRLTGRDGSEVDIPDLDFDQLEVLHSFARDRRLRKIYDM